MFLIPLYLIASFNEILSSINVDKTQQNVYNGSTVSMFWKINQVSFLEDKIICSVKENGEFIDVIFGSLDKEMILLLKTGKRIFGDRFHGDLPPMKNLEEITFNLTIANVNLKDQNEYRCKYGNDVATTSLTVFAKLSTPKTLLKTLQVTDKETIVSITICGNPKPLVKWYFEDQTYDSISRPQNLGCYLFEQIFNTPAQTLCGHEVKYSGQNSFNKITGSTKLMFDLKPVPPTKVNVLKTSTNCFHIAWQNPNIGYCTDLIITQVKLINLKLATEAVYNTSSDNMDLCVLDKTQTYAIFIRSLLNNNESVWVPGKIKKDEKNTPYRVLIIIFSAIAMVCLMMLFGIFWFRWVKSREFTKKSSDQTNGQARYRSSENLNQPIDESMSPLMNSSDVPNFSQNGAMTTIDDTYEIMSSNNPHELQAEENEDLMTYSKLDRSDRYVPLPTPSQDNHYGNKEIIKEVIDGQTYDSLNRQPGATTNEKNNRQFSTLPPVPSDTNDSDYENTPEPQVPLKIDSKPTINSNKPMLPLSKAVNKPAIIPKPKKGTLESTQPKDNSTYDVVPRSKTLSNAEKPLPPNIIPTSPVWKTENSVHGKEYQPNLRRNIPSQNTFKLSEKKTSVSDKEPTEDNEYQIPPKHKRANTDPPKRFSNPQQTIFNTKNSNPNLIEEDQYQVPNQKRSYTDPSKKSSDSKPFLDNIKISNPNLTEDSEYQVPNQTNSDNDLPQRQNTERYKKPNILSTSRVNLNEKKAPNTLPKSKFEKFTFPNNRNNMLDNNNDKFETDSSGVGESEYNVPSHLLNNSSTSLTQDDIYENVRRS